VAFIDHPQRADNIGQVVVVDRTGSKRLEGPQAATGIAWSADGKEVWFSGPNVQGVKLSGKTRNVANLMGAVTIHDIFRDGRALLSRNSWRREIVGLAPGESVERNLTWLDWSLPTAFSEDGKTVLFDEQNLPAYLAYLRRTDGSPPVLLGQYHSIDLSHDGKWALVASSANQLTLLPTGAGQPRTLPSGGIAYQACLFFPDGRRIVCTGSEPKRGTRLYVQDVDGSKPRPITPEGVSLAVAGAISPDGRTIAAFGPDRRVMLYPSEPGEPRPAPGLQSDELPIRWTGDGRAMWVARPNEVPTKVHRVDMTTGQRALWKELVPPDPAGVLTMGPILMTSDGKSYVYSYRRTLDELFLVEGLK
jgi:hypothetical protein